MGLFHRGVDTGIGNENIHVDSCCNKQIKDLPWERHGWHIARILKPKSVGE